MEVAIENHNWTQDRNCGHPGPQRIHLLHSSCIYGSVNITEGDGKFVRVRNNLSMGEIWKGICKGFLPVHQGKGKLAICRESGHGWRDCLCPDSVMFRSCRLERNSDPRAAPSVSVWEADGSLPGNVFYTATQSFIWSLTILDEHSLRAWNSELLACSLKFFTLWDWRSQIRGPYISAPSMALGFFPR